MLKLKNITKSYVTGTFKQIALNDIDLEFGEHEFVSILGPSGSGKTTLLNIIGGLDRYDKGDLIINNKSTKHFKDKDWDSYRNNCIGFVFQSYNLISHISILSNVEMSLTLSGVDSQERKNRALQALDKVGLKEHAHKKPNQLSGGQMQRVAIARALVNNPDIILADEPTGALDSKTSKQILELIKSISKDKLVIMVTHNNELAKEYSTRIVNLMDGKVTNDSNKEKYESDNSYEIRKTSMSFLTALKLSFNNIKTKMGRTLLTAFASSIGIIGIALILSLSNGFDKQIDKFESDTLSDLPIYITSADMKMDENDMKEKRNEIMGISTDESKFPDELVAYPYNVLKETSIHINKIDEEYIDYIEKINPKYVAGISYVRGTSFNLIYKNDKDYKILNTTSLNLTSTPKELENDSKFLEDGYDLLVGSYPKDKYELVIYLDERNRIDTSILDSLGIDSTKESIDLNDLINLEFKLVNNDNFYLKYNNFYMANTDFKSLYTSNKSTTLKIVGVVRAKKDNNLAQMTTMFTSSVGISGISSILYSNELIEDVMNTNKESAVVKAQEKANYNILTGSAFENENDKENLLIYLGAKDKPYIISFYPTDFDKKDNVIGFLDDYNKTKDEDDQIIYTDLASEISEMSGSIMDAITIVLISFSAISLVVSSIMIGIITYISVLERTKEIGILRSLGARKKDIIRVFTAETFIIGITSGIIGIGIARLLIFPANSIILELTDLENVAILNPLHALMLVTIAVILTLIGGFIPSIVASKKDPVESLRTE